MAPVEIQVLTKCPQCGEKLTLEMYSIIGEIDHRSDDGPAVELLRWAD